MILKLDQEKILTMFKDFYALTGLRLGFLDTETKSEAVLYPTKCSAFCVTMRSIPEFRKNCDQCDDFAFSESYKKKSTCLYKCHIGLYEALSPVIHDDVLLGWIMMGQLITVEEEWDTRAEIVKRCIKYNVPEDIVNNLLASQVVVSMHKLESASRLLDVYSKYVNYLHLIQLSKSTTIEKIVDFIDLNLHKDISLQDICEQFGISKSYVNRLFNRDMFMSVGQYISKRKIELAQKIIKEGTMNISEIANYLGFSDAYYFSRFFKKNTGITPSNYKIDLDNT